MTLYSKIIILVLTALVLNSSLNIYLSIKQQKSINNTLETNIINNTLQLLSHSLVRDIIENNTLKVTNTLKLITRNNDIIEFIYVTDIKNNIFAYSFDKGFPKYLLNSREKLSKNKDISLINIFKANSTIIYEYKKNLIDGLDASIYLGINRVTFSKIIEENINYFILLVSGLSILVLLFSLFIARKITNPLKDLTTLLKNNTEQEKIDFSSIEKTTIEIKQLVGTLSSVLNSIIEKENNLSTMLNSIGDAVIVSDKFSRVVKMNPIAQQLTGYSEEEAYLEPMDKIFHIIDATTRETIIDPSKKVLSDGKIIYLHNHTTLISKDKNEFQIADSAAPILNSNKEITGTIIVFHDVTEQYELREKSKNNLEQLERIFHDISIHIVLLEIDGTVISSNNALESIQILKEDIGMKIWDINSTKDSKYLNNLIKSIVSMAREGEHVSKDILHNGIWIAISIHPIKNKDNNIIQIILEAIDITERKNAQIKIEYQANYDALTGIANRSLAIAQLSQLLKGSTRNNKFIAVLFLDLDNFKNINDTMGHSIGDKVLVEVAKQLRRLLREKDIIARLGGDEFLIILEDIEDPFDIQIVCDNIIQNFEKSFIIDQLEIVTTISIGIAMYPTDGETIKELLCNSDIAMYHAKSKGKNRYSFFTDNMNNNIRRKLQIENELSHAFKKQEFEVYYQPKIDVKTLKIIGLEALLRWKNTKLGFVSPEEFIPIAEKSTKIIKIGSYVIDEVLKSLVILKEYISDSFRISINLSPVQFQDSNLIDKIHNSLNQYNIDASYIDFEITETALIYDQKKTIQKLMELKNLGTTISMDDFGTGYASLSYLKTYPFDIIKIDKSFIFNMLRSEKDKNLVRAIIAMAKSLELLVVAEGVETQEVLETLKIMECDYMQGYLFSKPIPFDDIFIMIQKEI